MRYALVYLGAKIHFFFRDVQEKTLLRCFFLKKTDKSTISGKESTFLGSQS